MISIIIPSREEIFLGKTVEDLLSKAKTEIEIIVVMDGYWNDTERMLKFKDEKYSNMNIFNFDNRVKIIHLAESMGMRNAINVGVRLAEGKYILKTDAHCLFEKGFDKKLLEAHQVNWIQVSTRKRLDPDTWNVQDVNKPDIDYMYLSYPDNWQDRGGKGLHGRLWNEKNADKELKKEKLSELMSAQGSCYFLTKEYYEFLELLDDKNYGPFGNEFQEVGLKCWLSGGKVIRNKNTWYAHLHKGNRFGRGYFLNSKDVKIANEYTNKWLINAAWNEKQIYPLQWLIKRFWPVPEWTEEKYEQLFGEKL